MDAAWRTVLYHALFFLDLYLSESMEGFAPPAPFTLDELDPAGVMPERPYTKAELYLILRQATDSAPAWVRRARGGAAED